MSTVRGSNVQGAVSTRPGRRRLQDQRAGRDDGDRLRRREEGRTSANMPGLSRMSGIVERDANLGAAGIGIEHVADEQDLALEGLAPDRRRTRRRPPAPWRPAAVSFSGTFAVTQTVVRSAIVMSGGGRIVPVRAGRHREIDDAARDRRRDTVTVRDLLVVSGVDADLLEPRLGALQLDLGGRRSRFRPVADP